MTEVERQAVQQRHLPTPRVMHSTPCCLIPFDRREGLSLAQAAKIAGKSVDTVRLWCLNHDIGRRVGGGSWVVSRVALTMFLDDDRHALNAYLSGSRSEQDVAPYFHRLGLDSLLRDWARSA
ncbi:helix-turn-helix domain-containing protein [Methylobacterium sp. Leaf399]|uniref:helix-turn-helix domain-containing protein n=1 Tax=Methylobacterium sp. Leaf399 TaxID=1736364 RepID=UPI000AE2F241|nr:helix-turn-helix domain-containing protein [Methylobacterium sp. Leaf399]